MCGAQWACEVQGKLHVLERIWLLLVRPAQSRLFCIRSVFSQRQHLSSLMPFNCVPSSSGWCYSALTRMITRLYTTITSFCSTCRQANAQLPQLDHPLLTMARGTMPPKSCGARRMRVCTSLVTVRVSGYSTCHVTSLPLWVTISPFTSRSTCSTRW